MNLESTKIKIQKSENGKIIIFDNETWKFLTNLEKDTYLAEALFNFCERNGLSLEEFFKKDTQELIKHNIIKEKIKIYRENQEKKEFDKLIKNKNSFDLIFFFFAFQIFQILLIILLYHKL